MRGVKITTYCTRVKFKSLHITLCCKCKIPQMVVCITAYGGMCVVNESVISFHRLLPLQLLGRSCSKEAMSLIRNHLLSLQSCESGGFCAAVGFPAGWC